MRNDLVSRLIDRAPTQELKDKIAELSMHDFGDADLEEVLENRIKSIREREDKKLLERIKTFYKQAISAGDKGMAIRCRKMISEMLMTDAQLKESLRMK